MCRNKTTPITHSPPPLVIPIFIPHSGCPHRCAFCNQAIITNRDEKLPDKEGIRRETERYLSYKGNRKDVHLAFFGGNFLGLDPGDTVTMLNAAEELVKEGKIDAIRFSTRPDTVTEERLDILSRFSVKIVELGAQSMDNSVLSRARRGHTAEDTAKAASLLKQYRLSMGMQLMVGLPGDSDATAMKTAKRIARLSPDFVRIYPLMVLAGSLIARWYQKGTYHPMSMGHCISVVKNMYNIFDDRGIPVIRMGLQASDILQDKSAMLAGPWHPAFGHLVLSELMFDKMIDKINAHGIGKHHTALILKIHPASQSRLRGDKNRNIRRLQHLHPKIKFTIKTDNALKMDDIFITVAPDEHDLQNTIITRSSHSMTNGKTFKKIS